MVPLSSLPNAEDSVSRREEWRPRPEHLAFAIATVEAGFRIPARWLPFLPGDSKDRRRPKGPRTAAGG